ncbi:MAG: hypothetical protein KDA64_05075, partial [Rhodospirillaceae bacterium]|nr:hypothetical protein [Rhodospirillaceae bacterium]
MVAGTSLLALLVPVAVGCSFDPTVYRASLPYAGDISPTVPRPLFAQAPGESLTGEPGTEVAELPSGTGQALPNTLNVAGGETNQVPEEFSPQLVPVAPEAATAVAEAPGGPAVPPAVPVPRVEAAPLPGAPIAPVAAPTAVAQPLPQLAALAEQPQASTLPQAPALTQTGLASQLPPNAPVAAANPAAQPLPQLAALSEPPQASVTSQSALAQELPQLAALE